MRYLPISLIIIVLTFFSCHTKIKNGNDKIVASVYGKKLYKTDLNNVLYDGINYNDSIIRTRAFIEEWIRRQLLLQQAKNNLDQNKIDLKKRLEEYNNSLIIYTYESELIKQNLDTLISDEEIFDYYKTNSNNFKLNHNIVKTVSVSILKGNKNKRLFIKLLRDCDSLLMDSITSMAEKYALSYDLNNDEWQRFDDVISLYNLKVDNQKTFLEKNKFLTINNDTVSDLIRICDFRKTGDTSPCEIEKETIRYIILNIRKKKLLEKLYDDLYTKALKEGTFEIY